MGFDLKYLTPPFYSYTAPADITDAQLKRTCTFAWWLAGTVINFYRTTPNAPGTKDDRKLPIKPTKGQTDDGLILVVEAQMTCKICTPLGIFQFKGADTGQPDPAFMQAALERVDLQPIGPLTPFGGASFAVRSIDGHMLPTPRWLLQQYFRERKFCLEKWEEFRPRRK